MIKHKQWAELPIKSMSFFSLDTYHKHWFLSFFSSNCLGVRFKGLLEVVFEVFSLYAGPPVDLIVEAATLLSLSTTIFPLVVKALLHVSPLGWSKGVIDDPPLILLENPFPDMVHVIAESFFRKSYNLAKKYTACNVLKLNILTIISNSYSNLAKKQLRACSSPK